MKSRLPSPTWVLGMTVILYCITQDHIAFATHIQSTWTAKPVVADGVCRTGEWSQPKLGVKLQHGWLLVQNDSESLYLLIDLTGDTIRDQQRDEPPFGDYMSLSFDVDLDGKITPNVDISFGRYPGRSEFGYQYYVRAAAWTGLQRSEAAFTPGFGHSLGYASPHRFWEVSVPLSEIGAQMGGTARIGLQTSSPNPGFTDYQPSDFTRDFSGLIEIKLAADPSFALQVIDAVFPMLVADSVKATPSVSARHTINADGIVEIHYPDGRIVQKYSGGSTTIYPDGTRQMASYATAAPPAFPVAPPGNMERPWLDHHSERLLGIIKILVDHDNSAINAYLEHEASNISLYEKIAERLRTIDYLVTP